MPDLRYVNLHSHSGYSLLDGYATIPEYVARIASLGHTHAAVTDHGTMAAMPDLFAECRKQGIQPIAGIEAYVVSGSRRVKDKSRRGHHHLTLLAMNETGYRNLARIATTGWLEGYYYTPRVDHETLAAHSDGVICLSGCPAGELSRAILARDDRRIDDLIEFHTSVWGERFFLEFQNHGTDVPDQMTVNRGLARIARKHGLRVVGTNDSHFCAAEDGPSQKLLMRVNREGFQGGSPHTWVRSNEEMARAFGEGALLRNSLEIAAMTEPYSLGDAIPKLPVSPLETDGSPPARILRRLCFDGLLARLDCDPFGLPEAYETRLRYELDVIAAMSAKLGVPFERYLLLIADLARFARREKIRFGPRGSAAGAIVCWTLGISEVDPVAHDLYFERFLNPERVELPDVDMDFADDRRDDVLAYLVQTYGADQVCRIATFATIGAKSALRDASRALKDDLSRPYLEVADELAALVPDAPGDAALADLLADPASTLSRRARADADAALAIDVALKLNGRLRGIGTHAAGIVVADRPLVDILPLMNVKDSDGPIASQTMYDNGWLAGLGLLKLDVLGLSELAKMEQAVAMLEQAGERIDLWQLPLDDPATWDVLCAGRTNGLFQLGNPGMTRAIQAIAPRSIDELAMTIAAYRPGAIANVQKIADRKHGREPVTFFNDALTHVLRPTWGFPVFQEQIIEILAIIAGYTRGEADLVRKAMGKKIPELMAQHEAIFKKGATDRGFAGDANLIWEFVKPFAGYGFNKSHAYCYAYLAVQSAWLKANRPQAFYAACLEIEARRGSRNHDNARQRVGVLAGEARLMGVPVLAPEINRPSAGFRPRGDGIIYGLTAMKGVGAAAAAIIVQNAPYTDLKDLISRTSGVTKDVYLTLARTGCLPESWGSRDAVTRCIEQMIPVRNKWRNPAPHKNETAAAARTRGEQRMNHEFDLILAAATGTKPANPFADLASEITTMGIARTPFPRLPSIAATCVIGELPRHREETASVAGMILSVTPFITKRKTAIANAVLIDDSGLIDCMIWPRAWERAREWLTPGVCVRATGALQARRDERDEDADPSLDRLTLKIDSLVPFGQADMPDDLLAPSMEPAPARQAGGDDDGIIRIPDDLAYDRAHQVAAGLYIIAAGHPGTESVAIGYRGVLQSCHTDATGVVKMRERLRGETGSAGAT